MRVQFAVVKTTYYFTFQTANVFSVVALAIMLLALTVFEVINPLANAFAMFPPPINPTFSSSAILKIESSPGSSLAQLRSVSAPPTDLFFDDFLI